MGWFRIETFLGFKYSQIENWDFFWAPPPPQFFSQIFLTPPLKYFVYSYCIRIMEHNKNFKFYSSMIYFSFFILLETEGTSGAVLVLFLTAYFSTQNSIFVNHNLNYNTVFLITVIFVLHMCELVG